MNRFPFPARSHKTYGFTLVEMLITLTVFILLSGAIFGIITAVLQSVSGLQDNQNRADEVMALQAYLKRELGALPGNGRLISYRRGSGEGLDQNGIIFGSGNTLTALDAKIQANGLYTVRLAVFSGATQAGNGAGAFQQAVMSDDASVAWVDLVHDVRRVDWRFLDLHGTEWVSLWNSGGVRPNMVEFSVQIAGDLRPTVTEFWLPPISPPPSFTLNPASHAS